MYDQQSNEFLDKLVELHEQDVAIEGSICLSHSGKQL